MGNVIKTPEQQTEEGIVSSGANLILDTGLFHYRVRSRWDRLFLTGTNFYMKYSLKKKRWFWFEEVNPDIYRGNFRKRYLDEVMSKVPPELAKKLAFNLDVLS